MKELNDGAKKLADGMARLLSGSVDLKKGLVKLNDEGVKRIAKIYHTDVKSIDQKLIDIKNAAKDYTTFTGATNYEDSTVKFIIKTDGITTDDTDSDSETADTSQDSNTASDSETSGASDQ